MWCFMPCVHDKSAMCLSYVTELCVMPCVRGIWPSCLTAFQIISTSTASNRYYDGRYQEYYENDILLKNSKYRILGDLQYVSNLKEIMDFVTQINNELIVGVCADIEH